MNRQDLLEKFGQRYMSFVRDNVLTQMQNIINNTAKAPDSKKLSAKIANVTIKDKEALKELIYDTVDHCLHYTLFMLEEYQDDMKLVINDKDGGPNSLVEISDGICGELYTEDGWIEKYSKYPTSIPK